MEEEAQERDRALVVGASSRIGNAVTARFLANGSEVLATYHRRAQTAASGSLHWRHLDLTSDAGIDAFVDALENGGWRFDTIVLVAGSIVGKRLADYAASDVSRIMEENFTGAAKLLRRLQPLINDNGCVLMFSSVAGERGSYDPVYAAAKGAIIAFVKSMAVQEAANGVRYLAVAPGLVEGSGMHAGMPGTRREHHRAATPLGRLLGVNELAEIVFDLTRPHWAHANGTCVRVNGGAYV